MPKASIILCTIRENPRLKLSLECLKNQTYKNFELIYVDAIKDKRPQEFLDMMESYRQHFPIIHIQDKPWEKLGTHTGICNARNTGIIHSSGDACLFMGDNTWVQNFWVERHLHSYASTMTNVLSPFGVILNGNLCSTSPCYIIFEDREKSFDEDLSLIQTGELLKHPEFPIRMYVKLGNKVYDCPSDCRIPDLEEKVIFSNNTGVLCPGGWAHSFSLQVPTEYLLNLNGFNECLAEGELIITSEGIKKIETINENDKILNFLGNFSAVTKTFSRKYEGEILEIIPSTLTGISTKVTLNHPILTCKPFRCGKVTIKPIPSYKGSERTSREHYDNLEWKKAEGLSVGDFVVIPVPKGETISELFVSDYVEHLENENGIVYATAKRGGKYTKNGRSRGIPNKIIIDGDFMRLCGYYLAEGSISLSKTNKFVRFAFHKKEESYTKDIKSILKKKFNLEETYELVEKNSRQLTISNSILARLFKKLFDSGAHNKKIPNWAMFLSEELFGQLFLGFWRGDGTLTTPRKSYEVFSVSKNLIIQMFLSFLRFEISPVILKRTFSRKWKSEKVTTTTLYTLNISGRSALRLDKILSLNHERKGRFKNVGFFYNDFLFIPIKKINKIKYSGNVKNLYIEDTNTYCTPIVTHNCYDKEGFGFEDCDLGFRIIIYGHPIIIDPGNWMVSINDSLNQPLSKTLSEGGVKNKELYDALAKTPAPLWVNPHINLRKMREENLDKTLGGIRNYNFEDTL